MNTSKKIDCIDDIDEANMACSSSDIISWYEMTVGDSVGPFEKGVIAGQSVNDILMIKGLIFPLVYIQSLDL
jgi:hypothetical protein